MELAIKVKSEPKPAEIKGLANMRRYLMGGKAFVTLVSKKTEARYTYRVKGVHPEGDKKVATRLYYVDVLTGSNNVESYQPLFVVRVNFRTGELEGFAANRSDAVSPEAPSAVAFAWFVKQLNEGLVEAEELANARTAQLDVYHNGRCSLCGRMLTVPSSLSIGLGPDCAERAGL